MLEKVKKPKTYYKSGRYHPNQNSFGYCLLDLRSKPFTAHEIKRWQEKTIRINSGFEDFRGNGARIHGNEGRRLRPSGYQTSEHTARERWNCKDM